MSVKTFGNANTIHFTNPSFLLRKIDAHSIYQKYLAGDYANLSLASIKSKEMKEKEMISLKPSIPFNYSTSSAISSSLVNSKYGTPYNQSSTSTFNQSTINSLPTTGDAEIFITKDNETINTMVTTNHKNYEFFTKNGGKPSKGGICEWDRNPFENEMVGIPIKYEQLRKDGSLLHIFYSDGCFCSLKCAFAHLIRNLGLPSRFKNVKYMDSEQLIHLAWSLVYYSCSGGGGCSRERETLKEAPSYRLIKPYGPLTIEEYRKNLDTYVATSWIIFAPVKEVFLKK